MKNLTKISAIAALLILTSCNVEKKVDKDSLKTQEDKVSYSIGYELGKNFKRQSIPINNDILKAGIKSGTDGTEPVITEQEMKDTMMAFQKEMMAKQLEKAKADVAQGTKEGKEFLDKKKTEKGVKVLPSGLMYKIIKSGKGKTPKLTDSVTTHYRGTLVNGKEFDSSYKRGEPATFSVNGVIKGWTEALQLMKEGDKWELYIPSDLAYGETGTGNDIPPNSTLIFEIELLKVNK